MSLEACSCSCQNIANAENVVIEYPFKRKSTTNFDIIPFKPLKERLLDNNKYPTFTHKYFEDIDKTLRKSYNFEHINEVLYYLERNPDIHDIVPRLLESISRELKKEGQQRAPILLKALYCLYTNDVSAVSDFSICINALEHYLTKSSTFPGDYVLKDIAADILSDFCAISPSDDLKEHLNLQLSRVFHNPNCHSYNLYGGIVGCLSNMSVKSGQEVIPYDEFYSTTFLKNLLSSPRMLRKLFYLCKPFIYSYLPNVLIPVPFHNKNSFYDLNTSHANVFKLMRNEVVIPIFSVKYDHKFSTHYEFEGGWFENTNIPADCQDKDLIWPGFSAYQKAKMLEKNNDSECGSKNEETDGKTEETDGKTEKTSFTDFMTYMDIDKLEIFQSENESTGDVENSESEMNSQVDSKSDSDTDDTNSEKNMQAECESSDDISIVAIVEGKGNLLADQVGQYESEQPSQDNSKPTEYIKVETNEEMMDVDSQKAKKSDHYEETQNPESPGFRTHEEYSDYLAWKRNTSYPDSHSYNKIGEILRISPTPSNFDESVFIHRDEDYLVKDNHIISSEYIPEESTTVGQHCCQRANMCASPSVVHCSSQSSGLDIFKNLNKNMFANWEYKKPKVVKRESQGAEKSEAKGQLQKKSKTRGGKKR